MLLKLTFVFITIFTQFLSVAKAKNLPETCKLTARFSKQAHFGLPKAPHADYILVDKSRRLIHLFQEDSLIKSFHMGLGSAPKGAKHQAGDGKTPEGSYVIDKRNSASDYHLSLHISYPDQEDLNYARQNGFSPGGDIMVHGLPNESWKRFFIKHPSDWTKGCVAVSDPEIELIWDMVSIGTPIDLCP